MATVRSFLVFCLFYFSFETLLPFVASTEATTLVSAEDKALLNTATINSTAAFDNNNDTCLTSSADVVVIQLTGAIIFTGIKFFDNATGVSSINVKGGPNDDITDTKKCGLMTAETNGYERSDCPEGIYAEFVHLQLDTQFIICEAEIFGFKRAPLIDREEVNVAYSYRTSGSNWIPLIRLFWPEEREPTCPETQYNQTFGTPADGLEPFPNYISNKAWFNQEVFDMEPNKENFYEFSLRRVFSDGASYFYPPVLRDDGNLEGTILGDPLELTLSRGPFCWSFSCENGTEECIEQFDEASAAGEPVNGFLRLYGKRGVCVYLRTYFDREQTVIGDSVIEDFLPYIETWSTDGLEAGAAELGIPSELFEPSKSVCYEYCLTMLYRVAGSESDDLEEQCPFLTRLYCCEEDFCFTAHSWVDNEVRLDKSCAQHLLQSDNATLQFAKDCFFPEPYMFESFGGNSGRITFFITETLGNLSSVELELRRGNDYGAIALSGHKCTPDTPFKERESHSCDIQDLAGGADYYVHLKGIRAADNVETPWSYYFRIHQDSTLTLDCATDGYTVEYGYGDMPNDSPTFVTTEVQRSKNGTFFDGQNLIRNDWPQDTFVPSGHVFRGYPSKVNIQTSDAEDLITHLFFEYSFQSAAVVNGKTSTYNASSTFAHSVNLRNQRISNVSGSFNGDGYLAAIQLTYVDVNGNSTTTGCYGDGNCIGFTYDQQDDEYVVAFSGKTDADGNIVALSLFWVTFNWNTYALGDSSCEFTEVPNWNSINDIKFTYTVSNFSDCSTRQSFDNTFHRVVYTNQIGNPSSSASGSVETLDGVGGAKITRTPISGLYTLTCAYDATATVKKAFHTKTEATKHAVDLNEIAFQLLFYRDGSYRTPYNSDNIFTVEVGSRIYFGVSIKREFAANMVVYAHTCYAKKTDDPDISDQNAQFIYIEQIGCPNVEEGSFERDIAVRDALDGELDPLSVLAFAWVDASEVTVHIHCIVKACSKDNNASCTPPETCPASRARRHILDEGLLKDSYTVTSQAVLFRERRQTVILNAGEAVSYFFQSTHLAFTFCAAMTLLLMNVAYRAYRR